MMNKKKITNGLIVVSVLLILYVFIGHSFVMFYLGGKAEILEAGESINKQCNENGNCPTAMDGWYRSRTSPDRVFKGNMIYIVSPDESKSGSEKHPSFRLIYTFPMPDDWFEVQGGVGKSLTSEWKSR